MGKYQLRIELWSDLCVSDGGVYNSMLDTDICHDEWGFPYIPAKRLKGCLRECALELNDWGMKIPVEKLFGGKGTKVAALRLGNAYLENYADMRSEVMRGSENLIFHPQNILNHFSYIRTQTSIDYETGAADETSLRTMRVANKGLIFQADLHVDRVYEDDLRACCDVLRHMGIARTRGLGKVQVSLLTTAGGDGEKEPIKRNKGKKGKKGKKENKAARMAAVTNIKKVTEEDAKKVHAKWAEGNNYIEYTLELVEPLICKSVNGGEAKTQDYIEGSKILGLIAQQMKEKGKSFSELITEEMFCSNAYLEQDGIRLLEIPASYYSVKNHSRIFVDKIYENEKMRQDVNSNKWQLNQAKHSYMTIEKNGSLIRKSVDVEERYHHRRPDDKSIGRVYDDASGDSRFYQISSIAPGQVFRGYLYGSEEQMKMVYDYLSKRTEYYLGYGKQTEYGKVNFRIVETGRKKAKVLTGCKSFTVKLESPAIIYNDRAMYSTDTKDLCDEIDVLLGLKEKQKNLVCKVDKYVNYTSIGGYNVTWNARKPVIDAFDKGTVLHYHLSESMDLVIPEDLFLGERIAEGFGEVSICCVNEGEERYYLKEAEQDILSEVHLVDVQNFEFMKKICDELFHSFIRVEAVNAARKCTLIKEEAAKPTVSNMILICKESKNLEEVETSAKNRFDKKSEKKNQKLSIAMEILENVKDGSKNLLTDFCERYQITNYSYDQNQYELTYLAAYLNELKYQFRARQSKNAAKGE